MAQFGKKKQYIEYFYTKPSLIVLAVVVILLAVATFERYKIEREMFTRFSQAQAEQDTLLQQKEQLSKKVQYLEGERGIEEEIRTHFDVAREGEKVVILVGSPQQEDEFVAEEKESPWYIFWR